MRPMLPYALVRVKEYFVIRHRQYLEKALIKSKALIQCDQMTNSFITKFLLEKQWICRSRHHNNSYHFRIWVNIERFPQKKRSKH